MKIAGTALMLFGLLSVASSLGGHTIKQQGYTVRASNTTTGTVTVHWATDGTFPANYGNWTLAPAGDANRNDTKIENYAGDTPDKVSYWADGPSGPPQNDPEDATKNESTFTITIY